MPFSATFCSFGDILSLCLLIKELVKALDESRGASAEYQDTIREFSALDCILLEVELLSTTGEATIESNALRETARRVTDQCRRPIETFLEQIKKYGPSLRDGGSGSVIRDRAMKIRSRATYSRWIYQIPCRNPCALLCS